jgi:FAD:protein FMN transferase
MIRTLPFHAMGCQMLAALDSDDLHAGTRLARVPTWFETWEASLSRFRSESELSELNRHPGQEIQVSSTLWRVYQVAVQAEEFSQGLVTARVWRAMIEAGYDQPFTPPLTPSIEKSSLGGEKQPSYIEISSMQERQDAFPLGNSPSVGGGGKLNTPPSGKPSLGGAEGEHWINVPASGLDFGGVAKGWAAHQAAHKLRLYGPALVDAGGDIAVSGHQLDGSPWPIGIADPHNPESNLTTIALYSGGVATSGIDYRRWQQGGKWKHHIIDPRSGLPAETDLLSVTVIAPTLMKAEVAAKVVLILGSSEGLAWLEKQPWMEGLLVRQDAVQIPSSKFEDHLWNE